MFILDTNGVSELRQVRLGKADPRVAKWADAVDAVTLDISAITVWELETGVLLLERRDPKQGAILRGRLDNRGPARCGAWRQPRQKPSRRNRKAGRSGEATRMRDRPARVAGFVA
jgi:hypothetical protein